MNKPPIRLLGTMAQWETTPDASLTEAIDFLIEMFQYSDQPRVLTHEGISVVIRKGQSRDQVVRLYRRGVEARILSQPRGEAT